MSVHEDNSSALVLAKKFPPKCIPGSKYYATKMVLFCEEINKKKIVLLKIVTAEQMGDIFTKGITRENFEYLRNKIMGW